MELKDIDRLTELARISVPEAEKKSVLAELDSMLAYVKQIEEVVVREDDRTFDLINVMRDDTEAEEGGTYTEALLAEAHETKDGFVKVKQIL